MVALLEVGYNSGCEDATADKQSQQARAADCQGDVLVVVAICGAVWTGQSPYRQNMSASMAVNSDVPIPLSRNLQTDTATRTPYPKNMAMLEKTLTTCSQPSQKATISLSSVHSLDAPSHLGLECTEGLYAEHNLPCQVTVSTNVKTSCPTSWFVGQRADTGTAYVSATVHRCEPLLAG